MHANAYGVEMHLLRGWIDITREVTSACVSDQATNMHYMSCCILFCSNIDLHLYSMFTRFSISKRLSK